jgi:hypothetical protein
MIKDLMKKYENLTDEEFESLPEEEKAKIKAEIEDASKKVAEQVQKSMDQISDEEKANIKKTIMAAQKEAERTAELSDEEILAETMNPDTEGYDEEDLKAAKELMKNQESEVDQTLVSNELGHIVSKEVKKGLWYSLKAFLKKLFK